MKRVPITDSEAEASATSATSRTQAVPHRPRPTPVTACAPGRRPTPGDMPVAGRRRRLARAQRIVDQALLLRLVAPAHPNRAAILLDPQHQAAALADGAHRLPAVGIEHFRGERQGSPLGIRLSTSKGLATRVG